MVFLKFPGHLAQMKISRLVRIQLFTRKPSETGTVFEDRDIQCLPISFSIPGLLERVIPITFVSYVCG